MIGFLHCLGKKKDKLKQSRVIRIRYTSIGKKKFANKRKIQSGLQHIYIDNTILTPNRSLISGEELGLDYIFDKGMLVCGFQLQT